MRVFPSVVSERSGAGSSAPFTPLPAGAGPVLLVEDDDFLANVVAAILSRLGLKVIRARDGSQAAQMFAENEKTISLVMLDCCLPDIDGVALGRVLRRLAPKLPIILTSGIDQEAARSLIEQGPTMFLPKPFLPSEIEQHVRSLLGAIA